MATAIPPLKESEKIEFGDIQVDRQPQFGGAENASTIVVASYNIRYAVGRFLISGGLLRKAGWTGFRRDVHVARNIRLAARAFSKGDLLPAVDVLALQEADKQTKRAGGHHV